MYFFLLKKGQKRTLKDGDNQSVCKTTVQWKDQLVTFQPCSRWQVKVPWCHEDVNGFQLSTSESEFETDSVKFKLRETKISLLQGVWQTKFELITRFQPHPWPWLKFSGYIVTTLYPSKIALGVPLAPNERYKFGTRAIIYRVQPDQF